MRCPRASSLGRRHSPHVTGSFTGPVAARPFLMARFLRWRAVPATTDVVTTDDGVRWPRRSPAIPTMRPALLLVHGFGGAKEDFADHVDALARRPPGRDVRPPRARRERRARRPGRLLARPARRRHAGGRRRATSCDDLRLLGHSMGGMVTRRVVLAAPRPARRASCSWTPRRAPPPGIDTELVALRRRRRAGPKGMTVLQAAARRARPAGVGRVPAGARRAPRLPRVRRLQVGDAVAGDVGDAVRSRSSSQPDQLAELRGGRRCPRS